MTYLPVREGEPDTKTRKSSNIRTTMHVCMQVYVGVVIGVSVQQ